MEKKQTLSYEQDLAATPTENIWVQANAGTGKTSVLVQRLLRILFRTPDNGSSGILCLTYTNAGAGEMRNRILKALRQWATATDEELGTMLVGITEQPDISADDIAHARSIFFQFIDNPHVLKIKTIHGFCEEILHRFPLEAGLSPSWSLISDASQRVLLQETFTKMINSPTADKKTIDAFAHIVGRISETYMTDLLKTLSDQYKLFFNVTDIVNYRKYFIDTIGKFLDQDQPKPTDTTPEKLKEILDLATNDQKSRKKPVKYLTDLINLTKQYIDTTIDFNEYKNAYLTDGEPRKAIEKIDYLTEELERVFALNQYNANKQLYLDTIALFDISSAFAATYQQQKRTQNLLDFEDLILYTRKLFSNPATMGWVLSQLDTSLSHILLDEAQDTSPAQWDILCMLSGDFFTDGSDKKLPNSLFVVGDTKQSIYGFQGADPHAFATSRTAIAMQIEQNMRQIREVPLEQSFRSTLPILHCVDWFFSDPEVIATSQFCNNQHKCFRQDDPGLVQINRLIAKQTDDIDTKQYAAQIADKIQELIETTKYQPKDIMILVQKRNPLASPLSIELKRRNIEVAGSDRIVLPDFPAIRDMLNLVRWCLNPADDFSLCCALKSPIFYLTEENIFDLCQQKNTQKTTVFYALKDTFPEIYKYLSATQQIATTASPYTFFTHVLNSNNTRQKFISALGPQVIDPLEEFLTICLAYERTQPGTLRHFIKWFITGGSEIKRDMDASSGVRIVTVHGSKGLEAPVVFLVDTTRIPKPEKILPLPSSNTPVWLWTPRGDDSAKRTVAAESLNKTRIAEYYRLLYVAMTRARDQLYIYGYTSRKNATPNSWFAHLWRVFANNTDTEHIRITNDNIA